MGMPEGEERERIQENILRENAENFPNMGKEIGSQCQDRVPGRVNPGRNAPRHILMKIMKIKDNNKI